MEPEQRGNAELLEWFGLTLADAVCYAALAAGAAMYFVRNALVDGILASVALLASLIACPIGMKPNPEFSKATNSVKRWSYIPVVVVVVIWIVIHYVFFNK